MKLNDLRIINEMHIASSVYLHGGPAKLDGEKLKRGGRRGHDMGAIFFVPESKDGYKYALGYAISRAPANWAIYRVTFNASENEIFDFSNSSHRMLAQKRLSTSEFESWERSAARSGHLDWASIDDELLEDWGFKGVFLHERSKRVMNSSADIVSIGIFNAADVNIIEVLKKSDILERMPEVFNN